jgi:hypothetical protein
LGVFGQLLTILRDVYDIPTGKAQFLKKNLFTEFSHTTDADKGRSKFSAKNLLFCLSPKWLQFCLPNGPSRDLGVWLRFSSIWDNSYYCRRTVGEMTVFAPD